MSDDRKKPFEERTHFDPQRSVRLASAGEFSHVETPPPHEYAHVETPPPREYSQEAIDSDYQASNYQDFGEHTDTSPTVTSVLDEVVDSSSINMILTNADASFLQAETTLTNPPRSLPVPDKTVISPVQHIRPPDSRPSPIRVVRAIPDDNINNRLTTPMKAIRPPTDEPTTLNASVHAHRPQFSATTPVPAPVPVGEHHTPTMVAVSRAVPQFQPDTSDIQAPLPPLQRTPLPGVRNRSGGFLPSGQNVNEVIQPVVDPKLQSGSRIGNYEITRKIGQGGMGVVYEGRHLLLPRRVAIKFLLTDQSHGEEQIRRFLGEAVAASQIEHKGVVAIYDYGYDEKNSAYLVMEYVEGQSLEALMKTTRQLPLPMALRIMRDVAEMLSAAHKLGIVHRDIKPDNLLLSKDDQGNDVIKVLDFGVAKFVNAQTLSGKTKVGSILGTPWYMPPEQCQGFLTVDFRSDIYALGCVLYHMLCGKVPFAGSLRDVLRAHVMSNPIPARQLNPMIPTGVEQLIARMMAKEPDNRPSSMDEIAAILNEFVDPGSARISGVSIPAIALHASAAQAQAQVANTGAYGSLSLGPITKVNEKRTWVLPVISAMVAIVATSAVFYFIQL